MGGAQQAATVAQGHPVPKPLPIKGFIDTGCDALVLDRALVEELGLHPLGYTRLATGRGTMYAASYSVRLTIPTEPEPTVLDDIPCLAVADLDRGGFQALLGRTVLGLFRIEFDGPEKTITLQISREGIEARA
jgi:hypothetical protein